MKKEYIKPHLFPIALKDNNMISISFDMGADIEEGTTYAKKQNLTEFSEEIEEEMTWGSVWNETSWGNVWEDE